MSDQLRLADSLNLDAEQGLKFDLRFVRDHFASFFAISSVAFVLFVYFMDNAFAYELGYDGSYFAYGVDQLLSSLSFVALFFFLLILFWLSLKAFTKVVIILMGRTRWQFEIFNLARDYTLHLKAKKQRNSLLAEEKILKQDLMTIPLNLRGIEVRNRYFNVVSKISSVNLSIQKEAIYFEKLIVALAWSAFSLLVYILAMLYGINLVGGTATLSYYLICLLFFYCSLGNYVFLYNGKGLSHAIAGGNLRLIIGLYSTLVISAPFIGSANAKTAAPVNIIAGGSSYKKVLRIGEYYYSLESRTIIPTSQVTAISTFYEFSSTSQKTSLCSYFRNLNLVAYNCPMPPLLFVSPIAVKIHF